MLAKRWTINVQVNTLALTKLKQTGTWERPLSNSFFWGDNIHITAISNNPNDGIIYGKADNFRIKVNPGDEITWVVSEVNPCYVNKRAVCSYGFMEGVNWESSFTPVTELLEEAAFIEMMTGFDATHEPNHKWLAYKNASIAIPKCFVRSDAVSARIHYQLKLSLVDIIDKWHPIPLNYFLMEQSIEIVV